MQNKKFVILICLGFLVSFLTNAFIVDAFILETIEASSEGNHRSLSNYIVHLFLGSLLTFGIIALLGRFILSNMVSARDKSDGETLRELNKAQEQIEQHNLRMQIANDSAAIGIWEWDLESNALVWDKWMYALYGITENQFPGVYEAWEAGVHPEDLAFAKAKLEGAVAGTDTYDPEFRVVWPSGDVRILKASAEVLKDDTGKPVKVIGVNYDITDLMRALDLLEESRRVADATALRMKLANDSAEIGVWEWDLESNELVWDKWMYALYGITENQFPGVYEAWEAGVHPDDLERAASQLQRAVEGTDIYDPEFRVVWPSGEVRTLKASAEVLKDDHGKAAKVVGVNYDITDRVEALAQLAEAKQQAEQAAHAKSDFLANMSHEIRTPMNGVVGMLQVLKHSNLNDEQDEQLDIAMNSAQSLLSLINDILDFSKIEAGKLEIEAIRFDLSQLITEIVTTLKHLVLEDQRLTLSADLSGLVDHVVMGDPTRLRQIITNLLSNAIKFTREGEVKISATLEHTSDYQSRLQCKVEDTGVGISESSLEQLFQEFEQADVSTTRKYGGTGLGLSICKKLCELMGGQIEATSEEGKGSCFTFEVDLARVSQDLEDLQKSEDLATTQERNAEIESDRLSQSVVDAHEGRHVLLVEDNKVNQLVAIHLLADMGLQVDVAQNGIEAISMLLDESQSTSYSLILMDCQMPEMDGFEATLRIRDGQAGERYTRVPIIAMTANAMYGDKEKCLESGMDDYLAKPVEERVMRNMLARWLA